MQGPPPPNSTYANASVLRAAAVAAGYSCEQWQSRDNTVAASAGRCSPADAFATYGSKAATDDALRLALESDQALSQEVITQTYLVGPNWIIANFNRGPLKKLSRALGGQLQHR